MDVDGILNHIQAAVDLLEIKEFVLEAVAAVKVPSREHSRPVTSFSSIASLLIGLGLDSKTCRSDFEIHTSLNEPKRFLDQGICRQPNSVYPCASDWAGATIENPIESTPKRSCGGYGQLRFLDKPL